MRLLRGPTGQGLLDVSFGAGRVVLFDGGLRQMAIRFGTAGIGLQQLAACHLGHCVALRGDVFGRRRQGTFHGGGRQSAGRCRVLPPLLAASFEFFIAAAGAWLIDAGGSAVLHARFTLEFGGLRWLAASHPATWSSRGGRTMPHFPRIAHTLCTTVWFFDLQIAATLHEEWRPHLLA